LVSNIAAAEAPIGTLFPKSNAPKVRHNDATVLAAATSPLKMLR
jgi:hypothetical protein